MRFWRIVRKILFWGLLLIVTLVVLLALLQWQTGFVTDSAKAYIDHTLKGKARIEYGELSGSLIHSLKIKKLTIETASGLKISVNYVQLTYRLLPLLHNKVEISEAVVDRMEIELPPASDSAKASPTVSLDSLLATLQKHYLPKQLLGQLPFFDIKNLQISASTIRVKDRPLTFTNIRLDLARMRLQPEAVFMALTTLSGQWKERHLRLNNVSFVLKGDSSGINLSQGDLQTARSHLLFNALLTPTFGLNLNLTKFYVDLTELSKHIAAPFMQSGYLQGRLSLSGIPLRFGIQGQCTARLDHRRISDFSFQIRYNRGELFVDHCRLKSNAGMLRVHGYWNQQKRIIGTLLFKRINLNGLDPTWPKTRLNGNLRLNASNLYLNRLNGNGLLRLYHSSIDTVRIDSVIFKLKARNGNIKFLRPSFIQIDDSARFYLTGTMNSRQNIDFSLLTFNNRLNHLLRDLGGRRLRGRFDGRIRLYGPLKNPNFSGNLVLPSFSYEAVKLDTLKFNVFIEGLARQRNGNGSFKISSGQIGTFPIDRVSFRLRSEKNIIRIDDLQFLSKKNYFRTSLIARWSADSANVSLFPLNIQYEKYWIKARDTLTVTVNKKEAVLESWELEGPNQAQLTINGFYDFKMGDLQTFIALQNVQITPFEQMANTNLDLKGRLNGYAEILTPFTDPNLEIDLQLDSLQVHRVYLGRLTAKWRFANRQLAVDSLQLIQGLSVVNGRGTLNMQLASGNFNFIKNTRADFSLQWNHVNIAHYAKLFKGLHRLQGFSDGRITVQGQTDAPRISARMQLDKFTVEQFSGDSLRLHVEYDNGRIRLQRFSVILDSSHFSATGWQQFRFSLTGTHDQILNEPFELHIYSKDNQLLFLGNVNDVVESVQGPYLLDLTLGGTLAKPTVKSGTVRLNDGKLLLSMIRDPLKHVQLEASIKNSVMTIERFSAQSLEEKDFWQKTWAFLTSLLPWTKTHVDEGSLSTTGTIDLSDLLRPDIDLKVKLNQFYADYFIQNISAIITTDNLTIQGRDTIFVQGDLYIPKGVFEVDLNQIARNVYLSEGASTPGPPYIALNLHLQIPGNFVVTSSPLDLTNNFRITFMGDLQITMQPPATSPKIQGHLEALSGKYASWNQNFIVEAATIDFKNNPNINPDINFKAFKIIGNRTFELTLNGELNNLHQEIRVLENGQEINMSYLDKIALLTLGADISTLQTNVDSTLRNVGETIATTSILTAIERGTERFTGLDKVEISSSKSLVDLNRLRLNNGLSDASIAFGKYLTSDLYVEYRTHFGSGIPAPRLSWDAGNRIGLQYRINRYWSLDSYYEKTERGNTRIKFGLNWEYSF